MRERAPKGKRLQEEVTMGGAATLPATRPVVESPASAEPPKVKKVKGRESREDEYEEAPEPEPTPAERGAAKSSAWGSASVSGGTGSGIMRHLNSHLTQIGVLNRQIETTKELNQGNAPELQAKVKEESALVQMIWAIINEFIELMKALR